MLAAAANMVGSTLDRSALVLAYLHAQYLVPSLQGHLMALSLTPA
jgi:hypothetical protein